MASRKTAAFLLWVTLLGVSLSAILFCGCSAVEQKQPPVEETDVSAENDSVYLLLYLPEAFSEELEADDDANAPESGSTVVTAVSPDELSAASVVQAYNSLVIEPEYGKQIEILDVQEKDSQVWVDFDSESVENLGIEEGYEGQVFYNLARSIVANLNNVDEIYFTMDGGQDFTLRHLWFEASRPFYSGIVPLEEYSAEVGPE